MKRAIAMTLVLFMLSLGGFTAVTAWMCRTQEQVEFTNIVARGEESVARGLHMTEYDLLHSRVLWTTEHDLGTESRVTKTTCGQKTDYQYNSIGASAPYTICRLLPETPELMAYLRQHIQNPADEVTINLADFAQSYDLCLSYGGSGTMLTAQDVKENGDYRDFPVLQIPVDPGDSVTISACSTSEGLRYYVSGEYRTERGFSSMAVAVTGGMVVTAGFEADAHPRADWAPEGYGLWLVRDEKSQKRLDLVYPLDIERQHVAKLSASPDGDKLLLFFEEDGQMMLQVLRGDDFTLLQTLPIEGELGEHQLEQRYYDASGQEVVNQWTYKDTLQVNREIGFYAVAVGKQLTVLQNGESGLEEVFTCYMPDMYSLAAVDGIRYGWEDEEVDRDALMGRYNPADWDSRYDFESMSMVLQDGKLAIAWNDPGLSDGVTLVEIYSEKGLEYARGIFCGLYNQEGDAQRYLYSMIQPKLVWAE